MKMGLCVEMALTSLEFAERVKTAARVGFKHVEMWWVDSSFKGTPEQLAKLAQANGVTITNTVINSPDGSVGSGLTDPRKSKDDWLARARLTLDYTRAAGTSCTPSPPAPLPAGEGRGKIFRAR